MSLRVREGSNSPGKTPELRALACEMLAAEQRPAARMRRPLGEVLTLLRQADLPSFGLDSAPFVKSRKAPLVPVPDGAAYLARTFTCEAGSRDYKVYVPSRKWPQAPFDYHAPRLHSKPRRLRRGDRYEPACGRTWLHRRLSGATGERQSISMLELVQSQGPDARRGRTEHHRRDYARHNGGVRYRCRAGLCGGPFSRGRHGRDHERHLSRTLRRDRHSLRPRLWVRHRRGFCICCHARRLESSSAGAKEEFVSRARMAVFAPLFFMVRPIKGYIRRMPKRSLPKLAPASPALHRRRNMTAPREAALTRAP